eukprot:1187030-Prorocentrum_minimum.AAC.4
MPSYALLYFPIPSFTLLYPPLPSYTLLYPPTPFSDRPLTCLCRLLGPARSVPAGAELDSASWRLAWRCSRPPWEVFCTRYCGPKRMYIT